MSLSAGKESLKSALEAMYEDTGALKSVDTFAKRKAQAIFDFVLTGVPMTLITFSGPASGTGIGGLDAPAPGMGLAAAKLLLEAEFIVIWTHGNAISSPSVFAEKMAKAIYNYFSQAIVLTNDVGPLDPITLSGGSTGIGGVLTSSPGSGYSTAKPILETELIRIWSQISNSNVHTVAQFAKEMAEAIHNFCIQGKVTTVGAIAGGSGTSVSSSLS